MSDSQYSILGVHRGHMLSPRPIREEANRVDLIGFYLCPWPEKSIALSQIPFGGMGKRTHRKSELLGGSDGYDEGWLLFQDTPAPGHVQMPPKPR